VKEAKLTVFPDPLDYRFAAPARPEPRAEPTEALLQQLRSIDAERCQRLVISGGSPTEHPGFVELVRAATALGFRRIALETDPAPLARRAMPTLIGKLGFAEVVVICGGIGAEVHQRVLRDEEHATALEGLQRILGHAAAAENAPKVYLAAPLVRANLDDLDGLVDWAIRSGGLSGFLLALPEIGRVPENAHDQLLSYSTQAQVAARLFRKCQGHNVEYGFTSKRGILPCAAGEELEHFATVFYDRAQYLKHAADRAGERFSRVDACAECSLHHSCPGVETAYVDRFGTGEIAAVPLERSMGWKLRRINRLEGVEYRNVSPFKNESAVNPRGLIRINGHCNMSCSFCFVDRTAPDFDPDQLKREVDEMARGGTRHLVFSGGEPTLHPDLAGLIAHAKSLGAFDVIEMQSNGVKCADLDYARSLVDAGLDKVTFSLHSVDADRSDAITRLPNAFGKTIQSIHNFRQLGVLTQIAHVITKANYEELPTTVRYLREEFPADGGHLSMCLAIAQGISDLVFEWVIPTFSEIQPYVSEALDYCLDNDVGFGGMIGQGGYPPCMLGGDLRYYANNLDKVYKSGDSSDQFYKPERCRECCFDAYCLGPRKSYVEHYGDAEIRPFTGELPAARSRSTGADDSSEAAASAVAGHAVRDFTSPAPRDSQRSGK